MDSVPYLRPVGLTCGILATIQSLIWIIISTVANLIYNCTLPANYIEDMIYDSNNEIINPYLYFLYTRFFKNANCSNMTITVLPLPNSDFLIQPQIINIWLWFYFGMNIAWLILSVLLIIISARREIHCLNTIAIVWLLIVVAISTMDCILTTLFGIDANNVENNYDEMYKFEAVVATVTMMVLTGRGFILWFMNIILAIVLLHNILQVTNISKTSNDTNAMDDDDDDHTSYSSKFENSSFRNHPSQWHPPIDAFNYSNNNVGMVGPNNKILPKRPDNINWSMQPKDDHHSAASMVHNVDGENEIDITQLQTPTPDYNTPVVLHNRRNSNTLSSFNNENILAANH